jgi:hypothetical protein
LPNLFRAKPVPRFIIALGVSLAILTGLNLAIHFTSKKSQRQKLLATIDDLPAGTDTLFLGNSLIEAGCDAERFREAWPNPRSPVSPVNVALGATSPVEHYLILKHAFEQPVRIRFLVYGFFDDQLNAPVRGDWADLVGNRAFSYYFPAEAAELYAPGSWLKKAQLTIIAHIPMLAERSSLWSKVELVRRRIEDIGMPEHKTNRYGRVDDFSALEANDVDSFDQRCEAVLLQKEGLSPAVKKIIHLAQTHGTKVVLVEMPMPSRHRNTFYASPRWQALRAHLQSLAAQNDLIYLQASDWIQDDQSFEDATHLNEQGAKLFSGRLAIAISDLNPTPDKMVGSAAPNSKEWTRGPDCERR